MTQPPWLNTVWSNPPPVMGWWPLVEMAARGDQVGITDSIALEHDTSFAGPIGITDALVLARNLAPVVDAVGLTDSVSAVFGAAYTPSFTDPVGITDSLALQHDISFAGSVGITDSVTTVLTPGSTQPTVKGVSSGTTSCTLPAHNIGDIIVMGAFRATNNSPPTKPTPGGTVPNFTDITNNTGTASCSWHTAYYVATATNTTSGTWGSTNSLIAVVLSGQGSTPIGATAEAGASGSNVTAPAVTMTNNDGSSALLHFLGRNGSTAPSWGAAPTGYTQQIVQAWIALDTKNDTTSDGAVTNSASGGSGTGYDGVTIEIRAH